MLPIFKFSIHSLWFDIFIIRHTVFFTLCLSVELSKAYCNLKFWCLKKKCSRCTLHFESKRRFLTPFLSDLSRFIDSLLTSRLQNVREYAPGSGTVREDAAAVADSVQRYRAGSAVLTIRRGRRGNWAECSERSELAGKWAAD